MRCQGGAAHGAVAAGAEELVGIRFRWTAANRILPVKGHDRKDATCMISIHPYPHYGVQFYVVVTATAINSNRDSVR